METALRLPIAIPYYTQRVTAENFAAEGYPTLEEGLRWTDRTCGVSSVRMVVDGVRSARGLPNGPCQAEMLRRGLEIGGYKEGVGWIHQSLAALAKAWGVEGESLRGQTLETLTAALAAGRPCIASVTPRFAGGELRTDGTTWPRGGHLIVVLGADVASGGPVSFLTHHPSCFPECEWPDHTVPAERFAASFSGNFIQFFI